MYEYLTHIHPRRFLHCRFPSAKSSCGRPLRSSSSSFAARSPFMVSRPPSRPILSTGCVSFSPPTEELSWNSVLVPLSRPVSLCSCWPDHASLKSITTSRKIALSFLEPKSSLVSSLPLEKPSPTLLVECTEILEPSELVMPSLSLLSSFAPVSLFLRSTNFFKRDTVSDQVSLSLLLPTFAKTLSGRPLAPPPSTRAVVPSLREPLLLSSTCSLPATTRSALSRKLSTDRIFPT